MRWDLLFADLESQASALAIDQRRGEVDERARIELARVRLVDRLGPTVGLAVRVRCPAGISVSGTVAKVGSQWLLIDEPAGRQALVALASVLAITGSGRLSAPSDSLGRIDSRLGLAHALRGIARDRSVVHLDLIDGTGFDGTIDRAGADFLELALHAAGEVRRRAEVRDVAVVSLNAISVVRRAVD